MRGCSLLLLLAGCPGPSLEQDVQLTEPPPAVLAAAPRLTRTAAAEPAPPEHQACLGDAVITTPSGAAVDTASRPLAALRVLGDTRVATFENGAFLLDGKKLPLTTPGTVRDLRLAYDGNDLALAWSDAAGVHAAVVSFWGDEVLRAQDFSMWPGAVALVATPGAGFAVFWTFDDADRVHWYRTLRGQKLQPGSQAVALSSSVDPVWPDAVLEAVPTRCDLRVLFDGELFDLGNDLSVVSRQRLDGWRPGPTRLAWNLHSGRLAVFTAEAGSRKPTLRLSVLDGAGVSTWLELHEPAVADNGGFGGYNGFDVATSGNGFFVVWRDDRQIDGCLDRCCQANDLYGAVVGGPDQAPVSHRLNSRGAEPVRRVTPVIGGEVSLYTLGSDDSVTWLEQAPNGPVLQRRRAVDCACLGR